MMPPPNLLPNLLPPASAFAPVNLAAVSPPDGFVSLEQLARCQAFMRGLAATERLGWSA